LRKDLNNAEYNVKADQINSIKIRHTSISRRARDGADAEEREREREIEQKSAGSILHGRKFHQAVPANPG